MKRKLVVAVTGASGAIYAKVLFDKLITLSHQWESVGVVWSDNARAVWQYELHTEPKVYKGFTEYAKTDFNAPFASGSAGYNCMIVIPCSMGTMARIANGISNELISRAADVMLKEQGKLILVPRDTPYNMIHVKNMKKVMEAGGIICPASPSFYSHPKDFEELAATVVDRVLHLAGFELNSYKWGENS